MGRPARDQVFISYSHKDRKWLDRLQAALKPLVRKEAITVWADTRIEAGGEWRGEIEAALSSAGVAVLLVSQNFLASDFITDYELPVLLGAAEKEGLTILWVAVSACLYDETDIGKYQAANNPARPLDSLKGSAINKELVGIARKIKQAANPPAEKKSPLTSDKISIALLPTSGPNLFGRDGELRMLDDAWADPNTNIITFVAWGGVGKTALVNHWLKQRMARENYRGAERVYGWSFFSQGASERAASADLFIDKALRWFGDANPAAGSPWDKGERLARFIKKTRTLLILDGLEPLQHPPGPQEGRLKDAAMQALLVELAAQQPGLCVISTRERIGDLVEFENGTVVQHLLDHLSPQAGAQLLRALNVGGDDEELVEAAREFDGHAFSLTLLGSYLDEVLLGDIGRRREVENLFEDTRHGDKAQMMLAAYEKWLGESVELAILRLLGLFDRPADIGSIMALRAAPAITGLTEPFQNLKGHEWQRALSKLRRIKLLGPVLPDDPNTLDAHPLVREYFKQQLKRERPAAWRKANYRLYKHLKSTAREYPDTAEEMSPLFAAVSHGCAAGKHEEVLKGTYQERIQRGGEFFSSVTLGAVGANLAALSGFFDGSWKQPVRGLTESSRAYVLSEVGFYLRSLGRLQEAAQPMLTALEAFVAGEQWEHAAITAENISELYLAMGDLPRSLELAQQSVDMADRSGVDGKRINKRATLANVLHQSGRAAEAAAAFSEAEELQTQWLPAYPFLYSFWGVMYCDLLLDQGKLREVKERAARTLGLAEASGWLYIIALDNLSLGRAWLLEARRDDAGDTKQAAEFLQRAVDGLRQAGRMDYLPRGLLARAELHRVNGDYARAERDLAETFRIAARGGMGLYLADYHLESARLHLARVDLEKAREHWAKAKEMIERMGYHRRDSEVNEIERQLR